MTLVVGLNFGCWRQGGIRLPDLGDCAIKLVFFILEEVVSMLPFLTL